MTKQGERERKLKAGQTVRATREQFLISVPQKPSICGSEVVSDGRECVDMRVLLTL